jgi:hypothetical protein
MVSFTPPGEVAPGVHWIGGWMGPRIGLDDVEKRKFVTLPGLELRPLRLPARSVTIPAALDLLLAKTRRRIITSSVFKLEASSLTRVRLITGQGS